MFHEAYERLAPSFGYETRRESAKPWTEVPEQNRRLMTAVAGEVLAALQSLATRDREDAALADLPAMTTLANLIRRSAWHALRYCDARFREGIDMERAAGLIAVTVTMNNRFPEAMREVLAESDRAALSIPASEPGGQQQHDEGWTKKSLR
jgi:hypothetical protein